MFQQMFRKISVPALAFLGLSLVSEAALAEQGWLYQSNYGRASYSNTAVLSFTPSSVVTTPTVAAANTETIQIDLQVPNDAKVFFNGTATQQTGKSRSFVTAPLTPGFQYIYTVRVQWNEGGRAVEQTRDITFMTGDHVNLEFAPTAQTASR